MYHGKQYKNNAGKIDCQTKSNGGQVLQMRDNRDSTVQRKLIQKALNNNKNKVAQMIDIEGIQNNDIAARSQLLDDEFISADHSVVSFAKVGSGFGHARMYLEHVDNNRFRNFSIELDANGSSGSDSDSSWMPSVVSGGRAYDDQSTSSSIRGTSGRSVAGSQIDIQIKYLGNIARRGTWNSFLITNAMGNSILSVAQLLQDNQDTLSYRALVTQIGGFSMNCASFLELIAQSAGMVDVSSSNSWGFKTPNGLIDNH